MKKYLKVSLVCVWAWFVQVASALPEKAWILPSSWEKSDDANAQQDFYYDFMWRSFIALNWPNVPITVKDGVITDGFRGQPIAKEDAIFEQRGADRLKHFSVWETYREPGSEVFLPPEKWANYPEWNSPRILSKEAAPSASRSFSGYFNGMLEYATDLNQPDFFPNSTGPLIDQNGNYVRYEVAVNQSFFTYIKHFRYYDPNEQVRSVWNYMRNPKGRSSFQRPPHGTQQELSSGYLRDLPDFAKQGMVDVKAAWRVLDKDKDRPERYLHRYLDTGDGKVQLMGLVALHILRFTPDGQVASTFEQIDNVKGDSTRGIKPSFNTGAPAQGLQKTLGFEGKIPDPIPQGAVPPKNPKPVSVYRVTPLPEGVQKKNAIYQQELEGSVFQYYELIGTINKHPGNPPQISFETPEGRAKNGHQGPMSGVFTNTNNLINAALESYTQENHSCIQCHIEARPVGVPTQGKEIDQFKTLTFLLQAASGHASPTLPQGKHLQVGEYLSAPGGKFFAILQADGNFCIFEGGAPMNKGKLVWCSGATGVGGRFFAKTNRDGEFCVYQGTPPGEKILIWSSPRAGSEGAYFAAMNGQGKFCVIRGTSQKPGGQVWCNP